MDNSADASATLPSLGDWSSFFDLISPISLDIFQEIIGANKIKITMCGNELTPLFSYKKEHEFILWQIPSKISNESSR